MVDNRDSYHVNALLDNYEEPLDISLINNNPFIPLIGLIGSNFNTPTNQNNEKRHLLPESTPNLPPNLKNKTPFKSKSIKELEKLEGHYNTSLVKSLKEQIDILQSEVYFLLKFTYSSKKLASFNGWNL